MARRARYVSDLERNVTPKSPTRSGIQDFLFFPSFARIRTLDSRFRGIVNVQSFVDDERGERVLSLPFVRGRRPSGTGTDHHASRLYPLTPPYKGGEGKDKTVNELVNTYRNDRKKKTAPLREEGSRRRVKGHEIDIEQYRITEEPFYEEINGEIGLVDIAAQQQLPVMLKGPTGCGKTRFVQHLAYRLKRPLITVACHEDLTASDLVGRYLLKGEETVWMDGPLTLGVKHGAIVYLDEIVEARKDTTVVVHPLSDDRRFLPIEKRGQVIEAVDDFMLVMSYNPGYQSVLKELKQSTKQRFLAIEFTYPPAEIETTIIEHEAGVAKDVAHRLVKLGGKVRNLRNHGLEEGVSTRLLIYAGTLMKQGVAPERACEVAVIQPITDDVDMHRSIQELVKAIF